MAFCRTASHRRCVAALIALAIVASCQRKPADPPVDDQGASPVADVVAEIPRAQPPMDRAAFLDTMRVAASAFAAGLEDREQQAELNNRRFTIRLPFACDGPSDSASDAPLRMILRPDGRSIELRVAPDLDAAAAGLSPPSEPSLDENAIQAVEGFWIDQPWLLADRCPAPKPAPPAAKTTPADTAEPPPTVGIAHYFSGADSRVSRRSGRDYSKVVSLPEGTSVPTGLVLVIEGRMRQWPGGKVIRCRHTGAGRPPACIAAAAIDRVTVERLDDSSILAEWTTG
jgi:hypothetical protein